MRQLFISFAHTVALCLFLMCCAPQGAAAEPLPLDKESDFTVFLKKYSELPRHEQMRYCALPFTFSQEVIYEDKVKNLTVHTQAEIQSHIKDWQTILPSSKELKADGYDLMPQPMEDGLKRVFLGAPKSEPLIVYSFKQFNKVWRLVNVLQYVDEL